MRKSEVLAVVAAALILFAAAGTGAIRALTPDAPASARRAPLVDGLSAAPAAEARLKARPAASTPACPQLTNPGGLRWKRSAAAGPWSTGGEVAVPGLGVKAPIVRVGVGTDGLMVVPKNARDVAWLDQGSFPGDTNNVVLAGHISYSGQRGSFARLRELRPGDVISVRLDGKTWKFQVRWNCLFPYDSKLASKIMGRTDATSVTLISCGGVFNYAAGTHQQRIAVRAEFLDIDS